eukprot:6206704-Pleurochrysis_carterae.AAC.6
MVVAMVAGALDPPLTSERETGGAELQASLENGLCPDAQQSHSERLLKEKHCQRLGEAFVSLEDDYVQADPAISHYDTDSVAELSERYDVMSAEYTEHLALRCAEAVAYAMLQQACCERLTASVVCSVHGSRIVRAAECMFAVSLDATNSIDLAGRRKSRVGRKPPV